MPSRGVGFGGVQLWLTANRRALSVTWSVSNRLWRWTFERLRRLVRGVEESAGSPPSDSVRPRTAPAEAEEPAEELAVRVSRIDWYHSIDLGNGVVTPGAFDHRPHLHEYGLPADMSGLRVLDVGTWDGFWAFEFEKRGADVVAMDIPYRRDVDLTPATRARLVRELSPEEVDEPTGRGFALARDALGSRVRREALSVYDLGRDRLGTFDVTHVGDLLIHLKSPLTALERVLEVTRGHAIISESYHPELDAAAGECLMDYMSGAHDTVWWRFGLTALRQTIVDAGFERVELGGTFALRMRSRSQRMHHAVFWAYP